MSNDNQAEGILQLLTEALGINIVDLGPADDLDGSAPEPWSFSDTGTLHSKLINEDTYTDIVTPTPGVKREDISVQIEDDTLKIAVKDRGEAWIAVGDKDDRDNIAASYVDGVLTVRVPRIVGPVQEIEIGSEPID